MITESVDGTRELSLRDYLEVARRRRWLIVGVTVLVVAAGLGYSVLQPNVYKATAEVLLQARASEQIFDPNGQTTSSPAQTQAQVQTEIQVMKSRSVQDAASAQLGHAFHVSIAQRGQTNVVAVGATDGKPAEAARKANIFARAYIETRRTQLVEDLLAASTQVQAKIDDIDRQLGALDNQRDAAADTTATHAALQSQRVTYGAQLSQLQLAGNLTATGGAQLVSRAVSSSTPISPKPARNAALALILGLVLGVAVAFARDRLDERIRSRDDVERATGGLIAIGEIPIVSSWKDGNTAYVVTADAPNSGAAEAYRTLRTSIQFIGVDRPIQVIQLTSAIAAEGKTTTLANLAVTFAQAGKRVAVVCCDLRKPRVHEFFGLGHDIGLTSVVLGTRTMYEALQQVPGEPRMSVLAAGPLPPNPAEVLSSPRVRQVFDQLRASFDVVLIDSPPILPVTDGLILSSIADATIIVATVNSTSRRALHRAAELLHQVHAPLVGTVVNGIGGGSSYNYYGGRYGGRYGYGTYGDSPTKESGKERRRRKKAGAQVGTDTTEKATTSR